MKNYFCGAFFLLSLGMVQVHAQTEKMTITFISPQVLPGDQTYISILLSNSGEVSVSRLEHWIEIPTSKLSYVSARPGIAADMTRAVLKVETQEKSNAAEDTIILHLSIQGQQPIPDGPVVEISLNVANIKPETIILPHRVEAFDVQGKRILDLNFSDAEVHISQQLPDAPPIVFSCFFYMH